MAWADEVSEDELIAHVSTPVETPLDQKEISKEISGASNDPTKEQSYSSSVDRFSFIALSSEWNDYSRPFECIREFTSTFDNARGLLDALPLKYDCLHAFCPYLKKIVTLDKVEKNSIFDAPEEYLDHVADSKRIPHSVSKAYKLVFKWRHANQLKAKLRDNNGKSKETVKKSDIAVAQGKSIYDLLSQEED